jgi:hypothetical protein
VHHVGEFPTLEDQMTGWDPAESGPSPDRVDGLVWALTELMGGRPPMKISPEAIRNLTQRYGGDRFGLWLPTAMEMNSKYLEPQKENLDVKVKQSPLLR